MYKAAVIGLGNIGMMYDLEPQRPHPSSHVMAYEMSNDFELVCGIDGDIGKEILFLEMSTQSLFFSSLDDAVKAGVLADVDVISICTPPSSHLDIIHKLLDLELGKVIFCEKPIVENIEESKALIESVNESKVMVVPNISRRWNSGLFEINEHINNKHFGELEKINVRYTRGIYNTGAHLFDLLKMWTGVTIKKVLTLGETKTSALPEKSFSFYFEQNNGVTGYVEAINDKQYYLFDVDLFFTEGKIEMRNSGDDIFYYVTAPHHLFNGFTELKLDCRKTNVLTDSCLKNAIENIKNHLDGKEVVKCELFDAIYPLYVANALERSFKSGLYEEIYYE